MTDSGADAVRSSLHARFLPRRARAVAVVLGLLVVITMVVLAVILPNTGAVAFHAYDRALTVGTGLLIGFVLWRYSRISAVPDEQGLVVRNLIYTTRLSWPQIVSVQFGGGAPWARLDLADGESLPVMAVQRADGPRAEQEARRLATLVALHSPTSRND